MGIALFGLATVLGSLSTFISPILFIIIMSRSFIPMEEDNLNKLFGEKYIEYKTKVRRWV